MKSYYAIFAWDGPDGDAARARATADHLAHVEAQIARIAIAGPLTDADGNRTGSLFLVTADSAEDAEAFLRTDPYFKAGVWDRYDIQIFKAAAGKWIGGTAW